MAFIDRNRLASLNSREVARYHAANPRSQAQYAGADHLFGRVPMTWMNKWSGGFPLAFSSARGAHITTLDGHELVDFALGDTGAMAGHSPEPLVRVVNERIGRDGGVATMLPTDDGEWVAAELTRRFGLSQWSFALTATDANRWLLRLVRFTKL